MDTFKFFDTTNGTISNYKPEVGSKIKTLSSADGSMYDYDHLVMCEKSKLFYNYTETTYIDYLSMRVWCGLTVYSDIYDTSILKDDATFDDSVNDWIFKDDDLNNNVVLNKVRETRKNTSQIRWSDLLTQIRSVEEEITPF